MIFIGAPKRQHLFSFLIYQMIAHSPICVMYNFLKLLSLHFRCILKNTLCIILIFTEVSLI